MNGMDEFTCPININAKTWVKPPYCEYGFENLRAARSSE